MKHTGLLYNIGIAIIMTVSAGILIGVSKALFSVPISLSNTLSIITVLYIYLLLYKSEVRTGKVTLACIVSIILFFILLLKIDFSNTLYLAIAQIWLTRSLLYYSSFLLALLDLVLCISSLALSIWGLSVSDSFIVAIWCFFLSLSLSALFPHPHTSTISTETLSEQNRFNKAYQSAEMAIRELVRM